MTESELSKPFKEFLESCFKIDCPALPKVKLVSAKEISEEARAEETIKDSEIISSMSKLYGLDRVVQERSLEIETLRKEFSQLSSKKTLSVGAKAKESEQTEKPESLGSSPPLILSSTLSALKDGSAELVSICHLVNPSEFYVHRKGIAAFLEENAIKFKRYVATTNPEIPSSVEKGGIYLVPFGMEGMDDRWYRAKVLRANIPDFPNQAEVQYIDYGNTKLVKISSFRTLPARSIQEPPFAIRCSLDDCYPRAGEWSDEANKRMLEIIGVGEVMMHVMSVKETGLEVDMVRVNEINHISVRDALIFLELASFMPSSVPRNVEQLKTQMCPKKNFQKGDILECQLSHAVSPSEFYCVELDEHYRQLLELMTEMTELYNDVTKRPDIIYNPVIGMPVAAQFSEDDKWYRAVITGLPGGRLVDVFYVDFGNKECVSFMNVRILPEKFQRMSTQAIYCSLSDIQPTKKSKKWSETAHRIMDELVYQPANMLIEEVNMIDNQPHLSVVLFSITETADICINALLVQEDAAISTGVSSSTVRFNRVQNSKKLSKLRDFCKQRDEESVPTTAERAAQEGQKEGNKVQRKVSEATITADDNDIPCSASVTSNSTQTKSIDNDESRRIEVRVLSAPSPGQFYVRLHNEEVESYINKLNRSLDEFYTGSVPSPITVWQKNGICVAFNPDDNHWYRSIIQEVVQSFEGEAYKVTMKDIGVEKVVEKKNLRPIEEKFIKGFIDGSIRCHLAGVLAAGGGDKWASYSTERFAEELNKYASVFITKRGKINKETKSLPVDLWVKHVTLGGALEPDKEEWRNMNMFVVQQGLAIPDRTYEQYIAPREDLLSELKQIQQDSSSDITSDSYVVSWLRSTDGASVVSDSASEEAIQKMELTTVKVKKSKKRNLQESIADWKPAEPLENLDLEIIPTNVNNDNMIYFHEVARTDTLKQIEQALLTSFKDSKPQPQDMFWSAGQPCIAQYHTNGMWYRGKIMKVNDDNSYSVQFVDYGNIEECRAHELRKRVFLAEFPLYCHSLYLEDLKPVSPDGKWPIAVLDFVHGNVVEKTCKVKLVAPERPGGAYIAKSFAPPGGIELGALLVGLHYATRASDMVDEDASSTTSESSDDVLVVSSAEVSDSPEVAAQKKWTEGLAGQTFDSIVATIMQPVDPVDMPSRPVSRKSLEEPSFDLSRVGKSSSSKSSIVDGEPSFNLSQISKPGSSRSSIVEDKINIPVPESSQSIAGSTIKVNSAEMSELSIASLVLQSEVPCKAIIETQAGKSVSDEDEAVAFQRKSEEESEISEKEKAEQFGDFLDLPIPQTESTFCGEVTAIRSLTHYFIQITQTSDESLQAIQDQYTEMFKEMQEEAPSGRPLLEPLRLGQECCALYDEDKNWYRAVIAEKVPNCDDQVMVRFVDFGNKQATPTKNLRPLKRKWMDIPRQCLFVKLHNVEMVKGFDQGVAFSMLLGLIFEPATVVVKDWSRMVVQLFKVGTEELIYQPLIDLGMLKTVHG